MTSHYQFYQFLLEYAEQNPSAKSLVQAIGSGYSTLLEALHKTERSILLEGASDYNKPLSTSGFGYTVNPNKTTKRYNLQQERNSDRPGFNVRFPTITTPVAADKGFKSRKEKINELKEKIKLNYESHIAKEKRDGKPKTDFIKFIKQSLDIVNAKRIKTWRDDFPGTSAPKEYTVEEVFPEYATKVNPQTMNDGKFKIGDTVIVTNGKNQSKGGEVIEYSGCICTIKSNDGTEFEEKDTNLRKSTDRELIAASKNDSKYANSEYKPGDEVRIISGFYKDFIGIVTDCTEDTVTVQFTIFGNKSEIPFKLSEVKLEVDEAPKPENSFAKNFIHEVEVLRGPLEGFTGEVKSEDGDYYELAVKVGENIKKFKVHKSDVKDI